MRQEQSSISHMQCWIFRLAQRKWNKTPQEVASLFERFDIFSYIEECYDILHLSSYQHVLADVEAILERGGVAV